MKGLKIAAITILGYLGITQLQAAVNTAKHLFIDVNPIPNILGFVNGKLQIRFKYTISNYNNFDLSVQNMYVEVRVKAGSEDERIGLSSAIDPDLHFKAGKTVTENLGINITNYLSLARLITKSDAVVTFYTRYTFKGAQVEVPTSIDIKAVRQAILNFGKVNATPLAGI